MESRRFAEPSVVCEGWYPVARAAQIRRAAVRRVWVGERDLVVFRDLAGKLAALDRACAHLGADLTQGTVTPDGLRCAFHGWCWAPDGHCAAGGGVTARRTTRAYAVRERWGLVWIWAGDVPAYELPEPEPGNDRYVLRLPEQRLACHPHVMLGNGLDVAHVVPVHGFRFQGKPTVELDPPHRLSIEAEALFGSTVLRRVLGLAGRRARWRFTTIGPSLAWVRVEHPTRFELMWSGRPLPGGGCAARTIFFLPRLRALVRAVPMMIATTWADRRILDGLDFRRGFVTADSTFEAYAQLVDALPPWSDRAASERETARVEEVTG